MNGHHELRVRKVVLYKHGVGYFERHGSVEGDTTLSLTFKQTEVSDVLKSLTVLDLNGGHIASVSYDSTKPLEQLLAEVEQLLQRLGRIVRNRCDVPAIEIEHGQRFQNVADFGLLERERKR